MNKKLLSFSDFVAETYQPTKTVVFTFGRFQPPTVGHELLFQLVYTTAMGMGGAHPVVFVSRSQDKKKNPLSVEQRIHYLKMMYPDIDFVPAPVGGDAAGVMGIAKQLSSKGYKNYRIDNLVMVVGSDRHDTFEKLLTKYNGKDFNFKTVRVLTAGDMRHRDDPGVAGMSGTKLRDAALRNDYFSFRKGLSRNITDREANSLMQDIRKGLSVKENFEELDAMLLNEGVNDKAIFKAVFLAGGPGSGKDFVLSKTLQGHGLTEINSDKAFEYFLDKNMLSKKMPDDEMDARDVIRKRSKDLTDMKQQLAITGRNGLIINGTGDNPEKYAKLKKALESMGYDTHMVFVNTSDDISKQRNIERGQMGGRAVPETIRKEKYKSAQAARKHFEGIFGKNFIEYDNSDDLRTAPEEVRQAKAQELLGIFRSIRKFTEKEPEQPAAQKWIADEQKKKGQPIQFLKTIPEGPPRLAPTTQGDGAKGSFKPATDKDLATAQDQHQQSGGAEDRESRAARLARQLGLVYKGFGRYGKRDGKASHMSVNNGQQLAKIAVNEAFEAEFAERRIVSFREFNREKKDE